MTVVPVFIFGLIVGSFLNVVIHRSSSGGSIFARSSICPTCKHELAWSDLLPVLSFLFLRGRCRYCAKPISWQYPLVELATAIFFVLVYYNFSVSTSPHPPQAWGGIKGGVELLIAQLIFASFLIVIFVIDLRHYLILDRIVYPAAILALAYQVWQGQLPAAFLGAAVLGGFFALLFLVSRGKWIGFGDVKLGVFLGLLVPWPSTLVLFFLAYLLGAIVSVALVAVGAKKLKDRLPFGTFLTFAAFIAMLYGEEMINWYLRLIGIS